MKKQSLIEGHEILKKTDRIYLVDDDDYSYEKFIQNRRKPEDVQLHHHLFDGQDTYFVTDQPDDEKIRRFYKTKTPLCVDAENKFVGAITNEDLLELFAFLLRNKFLKASKCKDKYEMLLTIDAFGDRPRDYASYVQAEHIQEFPKQDLDLILYGDFKVGNHKPVVEEIQANGNGFKYDHPVFKMFIEESANIAFVQEFFS